MAFLAPFSGPISTIGRFLGVEVGHDPALGKLGVGIKLKAKRWL